MSRIELQDFIKKVVEEDNCGMVLECLDITVTTLDEKVIVDSAQIRIVPKETKDEV